MCVKSNRVRCLSSNLPQYTDVLSLVRANVQCTGTKKCSLALLLALPLCNSNQPEIKKALWHRYTRTNIGYKTIEFASEVNEKFFTAITVKYRARCLSYAKMCSRKVDNMQIFLQPSRTSYCGVSRKSAHKLIGNYCPELKV